MPRVYIGLATTFHDPAIAIVGPDGDIRFAEATERFLQYKRAPHCEADLATYVPRLLKEYVEPDADIVVATTWGTRFTEFLTRIAAAGEFTVDRLMQFPAALNRSLVPEIGERGLVASLRIAQEQAGLGLLLGLLHLGRPARFSLRRYDHHLTHAAYACFGSPFAEAVCLVVDGMGETGASAIFRYADGRIEEVRRHRGRESVGFYFGLVTDLCGFDQVKGEEWKVMGLAPYGRRDEALVALLRRLYRVENGNLRFADAETIADAVRDIEARRPGDVDEQGWADLARAGQDVFEEMMAVLLADAEARVTSRNLVLSGGCALNSSFNGKIVERTSFEAVHVPSAPADDGNAVGAALLALKEDEPAWKPQGRRFTPYLGAGLCTEPMERLAAQEPRARRLGADIVTATARLLAEGKLVGWAQGRAEFGPRALGNRSILADPRPAGMKDAINAKVKYREAFRPFAPAILAEHGPAWFEAYQETPYMERTLRFRPEVRERVPAVVHADGTGRLQSVTDAWNPHFHALLEEFHRLTGVPILLNTSFNVMGKPILHTTEDAILMFYTTGLDALVVEDWLVVK
ncbi:carbamoyltransferase C-terminal domain-containing protein [Chelatococcus sp. SYSU_G07232]|uniref:Carbamoyltransferase C-terminal domain-containing protein n=1 Tax=Chelatococcus albus TaxID=3047466 RepID=A0ABT7AI39_9HYPH|nr:carbamoyltransferase C-terminal domain-containing protein [Chelatococcus sp. SYSU_G07232]MDJ1158647.1 carbamoyltransferase C-terminal domain-containing protein [Chelatococcus sp. SYSU_G07232]